MMFKLNRKASPTIEDVAEQIKAAQIEAEAIDMRQAELTDLLADAYGSDTAEGLEVEYARLTARRAALGKIMLKLSADRELALMRACAAEYQTAVRKLTEAVSELPAIDNDYAIAKARLEQASQRRAQHRLSIGAAQRGLHDMRSGLIARLSSEQARRELVVAFENLTAEQKRALHLIVNLQ